MQGNRQWADDSGRLPFSLAHDVDPASYSIAHKHMEAEAGTQNGH